MHSMRESKNISIIVVTVSIMSYQFKIPEDCDYKVCRVLNTVRTEDVQRSFYYFFHA